MLLVHSDKTLAISSELLLHIVPTRSNTRNAVNICNTVRNTGEIVSHTRITTTCVDWLRPSLLYLRCRESKGSPEIGNVPPPLGNEQIYIETMVNGAIELIEAHYGTECNGTMYQSRLDI